MEGQKALSNESSVLNSTTTAGADESAERSEKIVMAALYSIIILVGIIGNSFVITIVRRNKAMQTTTNYLLLNLAIGDIVTLLWVSQSQIFNVVYTHPSGVAGDYLCKFLTGGTVVTLALTVTIFTLMLIAVERYNALLKPMNESIRLTKENVVRPIVIFWILAVVLSVPTFLAAKYDKKQKQCVDVWDIDLAYHNREFVYAMVVVKGILPYCVILYCYTRIVRGLYFSNTICGQNMNEEDKKAKRKVAQLLITVTLAFYCSYLPYAALVLYVAAFKPSTLTSQRGLLLKLETAARFLLYLESCLNPFIYPFHSTNFRRELKNIFSTLKYCSTDVNIGSIVRATDSLSIYRKKGEERRKTETVILKSFNQKP